METPKEYYYTYYSYEEWGRGYFGSRKCYCLPEDDIKYFGSSKDKTFKPTQKIILKDDYATREEAFADEIILHDYYDVANNPHFANRAKATSTGFYVSREQASESGKKGSQIQKEMGTGIWGLTVEQRSENSKIIANRMVQLGKGVSVIPIEQRIEYGKMGGKKSKELGLGFFSQTKEQMKENGKKTNAQRWKCLETGYISTPSGLSQYQKKRGIDTSKRRRIS